MEEVIEARNSEIQKSCYYMNYANQDPEKNEYGRMVPKSCIVWNHVSPMVRCQGGDGRKFAGKQA